MIIYFFLGPKIFASIKKNHSVLQSQIQYLIGQENGPSDVSVLKSLKRKLYFFRDLKIVSIVYLGFVFLLNGAKIVLFWNYYWIIIAVQEFLGLLVVISLSKLIYPYRSLLFSYISQDNIIDVPGFEGFILHKSIDNEDENIIIVSYPNSNLKEIGMRETKTINFDKI